MDLETVIYQKQENVALVKLNRPEVLNAMNSQMWKDLSQALDEAERDSDIRALIITGTTTEKGKQTFSTGADLKESEVRTIDEYREYLNFLQKVSRRLIRFPKPTIAAINGYAMGSGYELALACDLRIAAEDAIIGSPEAAVSSSVTGGATKLLIEIIGMGKAKELLFTSENITGVEAARIGLVNKAVPSEKLMDAAGELADKIVRNSALSISLIKENLSTAGDLGLEKVMDNEVEACLKVVFSPERKKALENLENRKRRGD